MFGSKPHDDQFRPMPDSQGNTKYILDKIDELDKRLTKQIACDHGEFKYNSVPHVGWLYEKTCGHCGLHIGNISMLNKLKEELDYHKSEVDRIKSAIARNEKKD